MNMIKLGTERNDKLMINISITHNAVAAWSSKQGAHFEKRKIKFYKQITK
jgi:hypothetical protein